MKKTIASMAVSYASGSVNNWLKNQKDETPTEAEKAIEAEAKQLENTPGISVEDAIPKSMQVAAAWSWRFTAMVIAVVIISYIGYQLAAVIVPVLVALLLALLLEPVLRLLHLYLKLPRTLAATISLLFGLAVFGMMIYVATNQIVTGMGDVVEKAQQGMQTAINWLSSGPLHLERHTINEAWWQVQEKIRSYAGTNASYLASNAFSTFTSVASLFAGLITSIFCLFFFLKDGRKIWQWFLRLLPKESRNPINEAAIRGWVTLGSYARAQATVAAIDAIGIGLGAYMLGVPLALPLGVIVFIAAFIPILGAFLSGFIATMVALVDQGVYTALLMMLVILVVQQIESNILQPALMSSAVNLHPVAVFLVVAGGGYVAGVIGAIFSVPILAFINTTVLYLKGYDNFICLNYDPYRPGGAPGTLDREIAESLRPSKNNLKQAYKAKQKAINAGYIMADNLDTKIDEAMSKAEAAAKEAEEIAEKNEIVVANSDSDKTNLEELKETHQEAKKSIEE